MAELIDHVRTLAQDIGPRPATTDAEHRAAEWLATVFGTHGLETEVQEFDAPRTYSWAYVLYHLLTIIAAVFAGPLLLGTKLHWPAFALSAIVAFFLWSDLDTRWGLSRIMPKGPSQNVIARHVPRARRGERLKRIVVVAHYDSARTSLAFAPGMVKGFPRTFGLMKLCTYLVPVLILAIALPLPWPRAVDTYLWYAALVFAAYLLVPLLINVHRELFMPFSPGANDNAAGVAAMLGAMERLVPTPDATSLVTGSFPALRRDAEAAEAAGVVPEGAQLAYTPAGSSADAEELPDDFRWAEPVNPAPKSQGVLEFDTIEFGVVSSDKPREAARPREAEPVVSDWSVHEDAPVSDSDVLPSDIAGSGAADYDMPVEKRRRGLLGGLGAHRKERRRDEDVKGWLGVDDDFTARNAGADIGSWDNFGGDDDEAGWKGGWAGDDPIGDPEFAANEAARIRRRVTESIDRELTEKEIWFVATGAEEVGTCGMQALLRDYPDEMKDALIINIDNVGSGHLHWISAEGMARRYRASQRLVGLARRVSRETETVIKPRVFRGLSTDATPALARGFKAVTIMALGTNDLPENWHWQTDTVEAVDPELLETVAEFVAEMVRQA